MRQFIVCSALRRFALAFALLLAVPLMPAPQASGQPAAAQASLPPLAQQAYLKASNPDVNDRFSHSIAIDGDTMVVGAWGERSNATGTDGNQADNSMIEAGAAYVFVRQNGVWSQQAYLKPSNTHQAQYFGYSVAISGDTIVVGAWREDGGSSGVNGDDSILTRDHSGAAYVFTRRSGTWAQTAYLKASNAEAYDFFGHSVAIDDDTIVVGAYAEDSAATGVNGNQASSAAPDAGAAYVFVRSGAGVWSQQAYLKASNAEAYDFFGHSVAISGDTAVVCANHEDSAAAGVGGDQASNAAERAGAAYVFVRSGTAWNQQAYVKASNPDAGDTFCNNLAIDGDTLAVGARSEDSHATGVGGEQDSNRTPTSGAAYVFVRQQGAWSQQAYIKASNTGSSHRFGYSLAIQGDVLVVVAPHEGSPAMGINGDQTSGETIYGAAYVFGREGTTWSQHAYVKASNTGAGDVFGAGIAISDGTFVVGARLEDSGATGVNGDQADNSVTDSGAAYVFIFLPARQLLPMVMR